MKTTFLLFNSITLLAFLTLAGCGSKSSGNFATELLRLGAVNETMLSAQASSGRLSPFTSATKDSREILIDSYLYPIVDIGLSVGTELTGTDAATIYQCEGGTSDDCLVDLAAEGAVDNLLTSGNTSSVNSDTYTFATVSQCGGDENGYTIYVKAHALYQGTYWYTTTAMGVTAMYMTDSGSATWTEPNDYGYARQTITGCRTYNVFQTPIVVDGDASTTLRMFFELRNLLFLDKTNGLTMSSASGSNCFTADGTTNGTAPLLCGTPIYLAGTVESKKPDYQRYRVSYNPNNNAGSDASYTYGIYFKKDTTEPVGAYSYYYFDETYTYQNNISWIIKKLFSISDGILGFKTYGGNTSTDVIDNENGDVNTELFPLLDAVNDTSTFSYDDEDGTAVANPASITRIE